MVIPFDTFETVQAAHVKGVQLIPITDGQVSSLRAIHVCSNTDETGIRYILNFVCREMQRRFHSALGSLIEYGLMILISSVRCPISCFPCAFCSRPVGLSMHAFC